MTIAWNIQNEFIIITYYRKSKIRHRVPRIGKGYPMLKYPTH